MISAREEPTSAGGGQWEFDAGGSQADLERLAQAKAWELGAGGERGTGRRIAGDTAWGAAPRRRLFSRFFCIPHLQLIWRCFSTQGGQAGAAMRHGVAGTNPATPLSRVVTSSGCRHETGGFASPTRAGFALEGSPGVTSVTDV